MTELKSSPPEKMRVTEVLRIYEGVPHWEGINFRDLKKGDIFRLFEPHKDGEDHPTPDRLTEEGRHEVCVALTNASSTDDKEENFAVQTIPVQGI